MLKYYRHKFNFICGLADLAVLALAFLAAFFFRKSLVPLFSSALARRPMFGMERYLPLFVLTLLALMAVQFATKGYRQHPGVPLSQTFFRNLRNVLASLLLAMALAYFLKMTFISRAFLLIFMGLFLLGSTLVRHGIALYFRRSAQRGAETRIVILAGAGRSGREVAGRLLGRPELGIRLRGFLRLGDETPEDLDAIGALGVPDLGLVTELPILLRREVIDGVVFSGETRRLAELEDLFLICEDLGVDSLVAANLFPHLTAQVELDHLEDLPFLRFTTVPHNHFALFLKRVMDIAGSGLGLLLISPLLLLISALIKLGDGGPVFFAQERMGLNGRRFRCLKFRTMVVDAEKKLAELLTLNEVDGPVFKIKRDPRITRVGGFLRKSSLDELPQLWNVLRGQMSLVGPRPPIPSEVEKYERWQRRRLSMRPGITCLWQISGRSDLDFNTWMKLDLNYIDNWSLTLDIVILAKTLPAVFSARGAA